MKTYKQFKKVARTIGVPDNLKRTFIINLFELSPQVCATKYAVALKIAQQSKEEEVQAGPRRVSFSSLENGLDYIRREGASRKLLTYEYLNQRGLDEVDLIVAAVFASCEDKIHCHRLIVQIVSLLLLYLAPAEVFCVVRELIRSSRELLESEEMRNLIRWHLPLGEEDCTRMH